MATRTLAEELPPPYLDKLRTNDMLADDPEAVAVRVTLCHAMPTRKTDPQGKVFAGKTIQELSDVIFISPRMSFKQLHEHVHAKIISRFGLAQDQRYELMLGYPKKSRRAQAVATDENINATVALMKTGSCKTLCVTFALPEDHEKSKGLCGTLKRIFGFA